MANSRELDMGFKVSWIAFQGETKEQILEKLVVRDTGEADQANEAAFSGANIPTGWFILFSNDFGFVSPKRLASLSADCRLVACQVHEGVMVSRAFFYERGGKLWQVEHDSQRNARDLSVSGSPPPEFDAVCRRLTQQQDEEPEDESFDVDYIF